MAGEPPDGGSSWDSSCGCAPGDSPSGAVFRAAGTALPPGACPARRCPDGHVPVLFRPCCSLRRHRLSREPRYPLPPKRYLHHHLRHSDPPDHRPGGTHPAHAADPIRGPVREDGRHHRPGPTRRSCRTYRTCPRPRPAPAVRASTVRAPACAGRQPPRQRAPADGERGSLHGPAWTACRPRGRRGCSPRMRTAPARWCCSPQCFRAPSRVRFPSIRGCASARALR